MLRLWHIHWFFLTLLATVASEHLQAAHLEKVWEVDLKKALQGEHLGRDQSFKVKSLSFSPDAQQLVILLEGSAALFRVQNPKTALGQFRNDGRDSFGWSPDGQFIHSGGHVVRLADRRACELPQNVLWPTFMGDDSLIAMLLESASLPQPPRAAHLNIYNTECQVRDSWEVPGGWLIIDASPARGLLSVWELATHGTTDMIVNPFTKQVLYSRTIGYGAGGWVFFADRGSAICGGNVCWEVDTGKKIGQAPVSGGVSKTAARSSRVVLDDSHYSGIPFSSTFTELAARRRVWDFRSNKEVVSWQLKFLTYSFSIDLDGFSRDRRPIPCAISPDGEFRR